MFNGDEENFDEWEIQWKAFAQVKNIVSAMGKAHDTNMLKSWEKFNKIGMAETAQVCSGKVTGR